MGKKTLSVLRKVEVVELDDSHLDDDIGSWDDVDTEQIIYNLTTDQVTFLLMRYFGYSAKETTKILDLPSSMVFYVTNYFAKKRLKELKEC